MKCINCGFETQEKINFCPVCATEINQPTSEVVQTPVEIQASGIDQTPEVMQPPVENQTSGINQTPEVMQPPVENQTSGINQTPEVYQTPQANQPSTLNQTPEVYQTSEISQTPEVHQTTELNQPPIKDRFAGNVTLLVVSSVLFASSCCMNIFALGSLVLSILGVIYSNKVKNNIIFKNYDEAKKDSDTAKTFFFISLGINIFCALLIIAAIIFYIVIFVSSITSVPYSNY